ncbi:hypothetical protein K461DRAFT_155392 [Myriangium duriaei CBS 260.36]|uniref:Myb-like domain-containing protein n=1 Tax=Myriangium duriaei CBS 260.36 TaxID=1168546 RepID=A0A9P4MG19_9PEZI|nr:hypothetical protein K461DRAFT_155392 [Myriangium duriaei CBS 260.36]
MLATMSFPPFSGPDQPPYHTNELPSGDDLSNPMYYNPSNVPYRGAYESPYVPSGQDHSNYLLAHSTHTTPGPPGSSVHGSPWIHYNNASVSDAYSYSTLPPSMRLPSQLEDESSSMVGSSIKRSPSVFESSSETQAWTGTPIGLGLRYPGPDHSAATGPGTAEHDFFSQSPQSLEHPRPRRRTLPALAPNTSQSPKRNRDDDDKESICSTDKRRKLTGSVPSSDLAEEDRLLVQLKEEEDLPWKAIAARFTAHYGKTFQVAALQMRYKRLRERHRAWTTEEVEALKQAHEHWEKSKWEIISAKVRQYASIIRIC